MSESDKSQIKELVAEEVALAFGRLAKTIWAASGLSVIAFVTAAVTVGIQWGTIRTEVTTNAMRNKAHHDDKDLHMPASVKYATFVPRTEFNDLKLAIDRLTIKVEKLSESL